MINPLDVAARMREHNSRAEKISSQAWLRETKKAPNSMDRKASSKKQVH